MTNKNYTLKAIVFATEKHAGQFRKGSGLPYITHPLSVANIVSSFKRSKKLDQLVAAAILHDTLEDTHTTFKELTRVFTPLIASLVLELTSNKEEINSIGKTEYMKKKFCGMSSYALTLKLCDRLHNVSDNATDKTRVETTAILTHLKKNRKLSMTQKRLVNTIFRQLSKKSLDT